jgi:hypothetical protein
MISNLTPFDVMISNLTPFDVMSSISYASITLNSGPPENAVAPARRRVDKRINALETTVNQGDSGLVAALMVMFKEDAQTRRDEAARQEAVRRQDIARQEQRDAAAWQMQMALLSRLTGLPISGPVFQHTSELNSMPLETTEVPPIAMTDAPASSTQ